MPTMIASVRSSRWWNRYDRPSRMSRDDAGLAVSSPDRLERPRERGERERGERERERRAGEGERDREAGEQAADGRPDELVHRQLDGVQPAVGLGEVVPVDDARHDDWAAVSNSVSPTPSTNAATYSIHRLSVPVTIVSPISAETTIRRTETAIIVRRRSSRSASAPANSTNTSHGSRPTTATPAIRAGESVSRMASSGNAIQKIPSARFEEAEAVHSRQ